MLRRELIRRRAAQLKEETLARHAAMMKTAPWQLVTRLALPTTAAELISVIYNTADTYFVARLDTCAAAAVGVVFALMSVIQAFGFGIGMGASSLISRMLGAKRNTEAHRYASSAVFAAFVFGVLLLAGGEIFLDDLLRLLGSTETILVYARSYTFYLLLGAPVMCMTFVLNNILRSEGETAFAMYGLCSGGIINVFLDPLFIYAWHGGIAGAALATITGQAVSFIILLSFFLRGKSIVRLSFRRISFAPVLYWKIFSTGLPTICRQGMGCLSSAFLNIFAARYGDAAVAAITIANKVYMLVRHLVLGIGQGMQPAAGYNFGAGDFLRVRRIFRFSVTAGTVLCTVLALLIAPFAAEVVGWFAPDAEVIAIGTQALLFGCAVMPLMAYSTFVNQLLQVLGFRTGATFLACCRQGIFFFPALALSPLLGVTGLAAVQPAADLCTFLISLPFQQHFFRRNLAVRPAADNRHRNRSDHL